MSAKINLHFSLFLFQLPILHKEHVIEIVESLRIDRKEDALQLLSKNITPAAREALIPLSTSFLRHPIQTTIRKTKKIFKDTKKSTVNLVQNIKRRFDF